MKTITRRSFLSRSFVIGAGSSLMSGCYPLVLTQPGKQYEQSHIDDDWLRRARVFRIDGLYFDAWMNAWYHYSPPHTCYCPGCTEGFRNATGMEIPYHPDRDEYTPDERLIVRRYLSWKWEQMIDVFLEVRRIADNRSLPMTTNVNNFWRLEQKFMEPRMWENLDAVMYESIHDMLERFESVSGAAGIGMGC